VAFTEKDYPSNPKSVYILSKVKMEKAITDYVKHLPEGEHIRLCTVHPSLIIGPQLCNRITTSNIFIEQLVNGWPPLILPAQFCVVDVRDCARAHRILVETPVTGRFITSQSQPLWITDMAKLLKQHGPPALTRHIPPLPMPVKLFRKIAPLIDPRTPEDFVTFISTPRDMIDGSHITNITGFEYKYPVEVTLTDTVVSLQTYKLIKPMLPAAIWDARVWSLLLVLSFVITLYSILR